MKWSAILFLLSFLTVEIPATGQEIVFNGDFETGSLSHGWNLTNGNELTETAVFGTVMGSPSLCLKRCPGTPLNNGGFEQQVHLLGGVTYTFSANIAAAESG